MWLALAFVAGLPMGVVLGALGAGGSILAVPLLLLVGQPVREAVRMSLVVVGLTALWGAIQQWRRGQVLGKLGLVFGVIGIPGTMVGAWLHRLAPERLILGLFALIMVAAGVQLLRQHAGRPVTPARAVAGGHRWLPVVAAGGVVGVLTGVFGVGGGFLIVPALVLVVHTPMVSAVGTSLLIIGLNSLAGTLSHLGTGALDWGVTTLFAVGGLTGASLGGALSRRLPSRWLARGFAGVLFLVALILLLQLGMGTAPGGSR